MSTTSKCCDGPRHDPFCPLEEGGSCWPKAQNEHDQLPEAEPMKYHGPGWTIDGPTRRVIDPEEDSEVEDCDVFKLWAPNETRDHWAACWTPTVDNQNPGDGFFVRGANLDEVLAPFTRPAIKRYGDALRSAAESPSKSAATRGE